MAQRPMKMDPLSWTVFLGLPTSIQIRWPVRASPPTTTVFLVSATLSGFQIVNIEVNHIDLLHLVGYFNNQAAGQYPPSSTSISLATPLQTSSIYQQNVSQFAKQFKETRTEDVRTNPPRSNLDRLVVGSKTKTKRRRNLFSAEQVRIMETHFAVWIGS